jgi:hypothetical protein
MALDEATVEAMTRVLTPLLGSTRATYVRYPANPRRILFCIGRIEVVQNIDPRTGEPDPETPVTAWVQDRLQQRDHLSLGDVETVQDPTFQAEHGRDVYDTDLPELTP